MFVTITCVLTIAIIVSMWPATYRIVAKWRSLPTSVCRCPDPQTLMFNRTAKVQAIGTMFLTVAVIPAMLFVLFGR